MGNIPIKAQVDISAGTITLDTGGGIYPVGGEAGLPDNLDTVSGLASGDVAILVPPASGESITARHNVGNLRIEGSIGFSLNDPPDYLYLINNGTVILAFGVNVTGTLVEAPPEEVEAVTGVAGIKRRRKITPRERAFLQRLGQPRELIVRIEEQLDQIDIAPVPVMLPAQQDVFETRLASAESDVEALEVLTEALEVEHEALAIELRAIIDAVYEQEMAALLLTLVAADAV